MRRTTKKIRYMTALAVAFAVLLAGISATLLIDRDRIDFDIETPGVVAAPRDQHDVSSSTLLDGRYGVALSSGKITQKAIGGKRLTGREARATLKAGKAVLELHKGTMVIGSPLDALEQQFSPYPPLIAALRSLSFSVLEISQGRISVILPSGRNEWLFNVNLVVQPRRSQGLSAQGTAVWRGHKIAIDVDAGRVSTTENQLPARVRLSSQLFSVSFNGQIGFSNGLELTGNAEIGGKDTRQFARSLRIIWPEWAGISDFEMSSPMTWTATALTFEKVRARFDDNEATGIVAVKGSREKPQITGTLAFDTLDLTKYWTMRASESEAVGQSWWERVAAAWSEPLIRHFDADLRMSANQVVVDSMALGKAAATVALKDGKLSAQLAKLSFAGGSGSGQVTIDQSRLIPKTSFHGRFVNVPLGDLTSSIFGIRGIEGRATVTADLRSQGLEQKDILSGLEGDLRLELSDTGVVGFDLNALATKDLTVNSEVAGSRPVNLLSEFLRGTTRLSALKVDFGLHSGQLLSKKFEALSDDHRLQLSGNADLVKRTIDFYGTVNKRVAPSSETSSVAPESSAESDSEGSRSIRLTGPLSKLNLEVRDGVASSAATK